ncbi:peptidase S1 [soil metagenome]
MKTTRTAVALTAILAAGAAMVMADAASAQTSSLRPNFGSVRLRSGFTPDPYTVSVYGGGSIDAYKDTDLPGACVGNISDAPDFSVTYTAGSLPLAFRTVSSSDTSLIINGPDGRWSCDDDSFGDLDAQVIFNRPQSGKYDVWVGVLGSSGAQATLGITETP